MLSSTRFEVQCLGLRRCVLAAMLAMGIAGFVPLRSSCQADPLDPAAFSSIGPSPFGGSAGFTIDTSIPLITGGATPINGVVAAGNIAVFTFDNIVIPTGTT